MEKQNIQRYGIGDQCRGCIEIVDAAHCKASLAVLVGARVALARGIEWHIQGRRSVAGATSAGIFGGYPNLAVFPVQLWLCLDKRNPESR